MAGMAANKPSIERIGFLLVLVVCVLGLNLFIFLETRAFLGISRQNVEESARQWTKNLALALEREVAGQVERIDLVLLAAIDEIRHETDTHGSVDAARLQAFLQRQRERLPHADAIRITDAQGLLRYATDIDPARRIDLSDREHFIKLKARPDSGLLISSPQQSRANGKWVVVFARAVTGADGSFQGMAFIPVAISSLTETFTSIEVPAQGSITLRSSDLKIIARYPPPEGKATIGQAKVSQPLLDLLARGAAEGSFYAVTPLDGIPRQLSFRKVGELPLLLIVGRAQPEYLAPWYRQRSFAILTDVSFALLTLLLSTLIYRYWRQVINARDELAHMAMTDYLTGLVNRRAFIDATNVEIARSLRYAAPMSLLMFDVDHFKAINDSHGHEMGDLVLQKLAEITRGTLRAVDLVGRWGGEEFVVLLPETDASRAAEVAERLRSNIEAMNITGADPVIRVTISVGYATLARNVPDINALIKRADEALYQAKESGRNRTVQG